MVWFFFLLFLGTSATKLDGDALLAFKNGLDDPDNIFDWSNDSSPYQWKGVECNGAAVVSISLANIGLRGKISPQLGFLMHLETLNLTRNLLYGTIPPQIWSLKNLKHLDLSFIQLSGAIDSNIKQLSDLE